MGKGFEFVYVLVLEDESGNDYLAISPCGSAEPKDLVLVNNDVLCEVKECAYINRLSEEFKLLEKMVELAEVSAVYSLAWEKEDGNDAAVFQNS